MRRKNKERPSPEQVRAKGNYIAFGQEKKEVQDTLKEADKIEGLVIKAPSWSGLKRKAPRITPKRPKLRR